MVAGQLKKKKKKKSFRQLSKKATVKDARVNGDELEIVLLCSGDGSAGAEGNDQDAGFGAGASAGAGATAGTGDAMGMTETQFTIASLSHQSVPVLFDPSLPPLPPPSPPPEDVLRLSDGRVVQRSGIYQDWFLTLGVKEQNPLSRQLGIYGETSLKLQARKHKKKLAQRKFRIKLYQHQQQQQQQQHDYHKVFACHRNSNSKHND